MKDRYIDVSKYQGTIDWSQAKASGIKGAILRAVSTDKNGLYIDATFERNYNECKRYGIPCGAYFFSYATNTAYLDKELALFRKAISGKSFELPLVMDVEDASQKSLGKQNLANLIKYGMEQIQSWKCFAMWYTYKSFLYYIDTSILKNYAFWLAWYTDAEPSRTAYGHEIWQYTSSLAVAGIGGRVDANFCYKDFPSIIHNANLNILDAAEQIDTSVEVNPQNGADVPYISTEPIQMLIGYASSGDVATITQKIESLGIPCTTADGYITTSAVSVGDQKTIIAECIRLNIPYERYVPQNESVNEYTEEQSLVIKFIKWLIKTFNIEVM